MRCRVRKRQVQYEPKLYFYRKHMGMRHRPAFRSPEVLIGFVSIFAISTFIVNEQTSKRLITKGAQKLIKDVSKAGFKTAFKGGAMLVGGAVGLAFALPEAIDNWKDMIEKKHVTEASQSLRDTADEIENACRTLREELDEIQRTFDEMAKLQEDTDTSSEEESEEEESDQEEKDSHGSSVSWFLKRRYTKPSCHCSQGASKEERVRNLVLAESEEESESNRDSEEESEEERESDQDSHSENEKDRESNRDSEEENEEERESGQDSHSESEEDSVSNRDSEEESEEERESDQDSHSESEKDSDSNRDSEEESEEERDSDQDSHSESEEDRESNRDSEEENEEERESGQDSHSESEEESVSNRDSEEESEEERESDQDSHSESEKDRESNRDSEEESGEERASDQDSHSESEEDRESNRDSEEESEVERASNRDEKIKGVKQSERYQGKLSENEIKRGERHELEREEQRNSEQNQGVGIRMALLNIRSLTKKWAKVLELIRNNNIDVFLSTETWLQDGSGDDILIKASPPDFTFHHEAREGRGGGVAIQFSRAFQDDRLYFDHITTFEYVAVVLQNDDTPILVINIYHPPGYTRGQFHCFLDEFQMLLNYSFEIYEHIIITGDFNIHIDNGMQSSAIEFYFLLLLNNLEQHVNEPTHRRGHTLDLVITRNVVISNLHVEDHTISDHSTVIFIATPILTDGKKKSKRKVKENKKSRRFKKNEP
ncbi:protein starmaker-like [Lampris incognitus]|uniref:protein starmaker-like n=1 Tax=Lampris incognitus TaxID=2546036 RepID=UPI0024B579AB|nr:protein starmaker-like [Lampris incognitus]